MNERHIAFAMALALGLCAMGEPRPIDLVQPKALGLPAAVSVTTVQLHIRDGTTPFAQHHVMETLEWLYDSRDSYQGSLGWSPSDLTYATSSETLIFDTRDGRAYRDDRLSRTGTTRIDGIASPLGWIRQANFIVSHGGTSSTGYDEVGNLVVKFVSATSSQNDVTFVLDHGKHMLKKVLQGRDQISAIHEYTDWRLLPTGEQFPYQLTSHYLPIGKSEEFTAKLLVQSASTQVPATPPTPSLPPSAIIDDRLKGTITDVNGKSVEVTAPPGAPPRVGFRVTPTQWIAGSGVLLLVGALVVHRFRARR